MSAQNKNLPSAAFEESLKAELESAIAEEERIIQELAKARYRIQQVCNRAVMHSEPGTSLRIKAVFQLKRLKYSRVQES